MARKFATVAATAVAALACAVPATAATPVVVGQAQLGGTPDIAVDGAGTAHIVWEETSTAVDEVRYCRLPRGAAACVDPETFVGAQPIDDDGISGRPHVFVSGAGTVTVFHQRGLTGSGYMMANRSTDGGLNFGARNRTGEAFPSSAGPREAVLQPNGTITAITEVTTAGTYVQNGSPLDNVPTGDHAQLLSSESGEDAAIGVDPATNKPVAVYEQQSDPQKLSWRKLLGAGTEADINSLAQWGPEQLLSADSIGAADGPALASGPNGLFLFWQQRQPDRGWVSKFTGSGWSAPVPLVTGQSFTEYDLQQDAAGRLHAVWHAYSDDELRYSWSDDGVNWAPVVDIARGEDYRHVRVSAAPDHAGFAVWDRDGVEVAAVPLEALPEPPAGPAEPDTTAPSVDGFSAGDTTLRPGQGTTFRFTTSEAGLAILTVRKQVPGLKVGKGRKRSCVPRTRKLVRKLRRSSPTTKAFKKKLKKRSCKARKPIGRMLKQVPAGQNSIVWNGRLAGRKLRPGRYFALLQIRDGAGNFSAVETIRFRVLKPKKRRG